MRVFKIILLCLAIILLLCGCVPVHREPDSQPFPTTDPIALLEVSPLCQNPDFPTGCEATAAVTALHYWGEDISIGDFLDGYVEMEGNPQQIGIEWYGPDPNRVFVGDPRSTTGFGCFSSVVVQALERYFETDKHLEYRESLSITELCSRYIDRGIPVIIWATSYMRPLKKGLSWTLPDGTLFTWPSGEHCLVLVGYSASEYFFCDPKYTEIVAYDRSLTEQRYDDMGRQYIAILPDAKSR